MTWQAIHCSWLPPLWPQDVTGLVWLGWGTHSHNFPNKELYKIVIFVYFLRTDTFQCNYVEDCWGSLVSNKSMHPKEINCKRMNEWLRESVSKTCVFGTTNHMQYTNQWIKKYKQKKNSCGYWYTVSRLYQETRQWKLLTVQTTTQTKWMDRCM